MNKIPTIIMFLFVFPCMAQDYSDLIIRNNGDTIRCKITLVNDANIFYSYRKKKSDLSEHIPIASVKEYYQNGTKGTSTSEPAPKSNDPVSTTVPVRINENYNVSAGDELIKAQNNGYLGLGFTALGSVVVGAGMVSAVAGGDDFQTMALIGGGIYIVGFIFLIESKSHIGKAGNLLKGSGVTLGVDQKGLTLCYKF